MRWCVGESFHYRETTTSKYIQQESRQGIYTSSISHVSTAWYSSAPLHSLLVPGTFLYFVLLDVDRHFSWSSWRCHVKLLWQHHTNTQQWREMWKWWLLVWARRQTLFQKQQLKKKQGEFESAHRVRDLCGCSQTVICCPSCVLATINNSWKQKKIEWSQTMQWKQHQTFTAALPPDMKSWGDEFKEDWQQNATLYTRGNKSLLFFIRIVWCVWCKSQCY